MRARRFLVGACLVVATVISWADSAGATARGNPPTINACMGMIVSYGDHPEMSPAFFARDIDGVPVQTVMSWTREFCDSIR